MLRTMRQKMAIVIWILVIAFVGTIIFSWGMGGVQSSDPRVKGIIAEVNGEDVSYDELRALEDNKVKSQNNKEMTDVDAARLRNQAWDDLVSMVVFRQEVLENEIIVSPSKLYGEILENPVDDLKQNPQFLENGRFSQKKYEDFIKNPRPEFGDLYRAIEGVYLNRLPGIMMDDMAKRSVYVTDYEARKDFIDNNVKSEVKYIKVSAKAYEIADSTITNEEMEKYFAENKDKLNKTPERRNFEYVLFSKEMTKEDSNIIREDIQFALDEINKGQKFESVAKAYSEDGSAANGGSLGWFGRGRMVPAFEKAAFEAEVGEVVGPVETRFGAHLIKVEDKKEKDGEITEINARHILIKWKASSETIDEARYTAAQFEEELFQNGKTSEAFDIAVKNTGAEVKVSEYIGKTDRTDEFGFVPGIGDFLFDNETGAVSARLYSTRGYLFIRINSVIPETEKTLDEVKDYIRGRIKMERQLDMAITDLKEVYPQLSDTTSFNNFASDEKFNVGITKPFGKKNFVQGIGRDPEFISKAFDLEVGKVSEPFKGETNAYIMTVVNRDEFSEETFDKEKSKIKEKLAKSKNNRVFNLWLTELREDAKIEDYRSLYNR